MKKLAQFFEPTWRKLTLVIVLTLATFVGLSQTVLKQEIPGTSKKSKAAAVLDVKTYGAVGDGIIDDTSAFKSAMADAVSGDTIIAPSGTYLISSPVTFKSGVKFTGISNPTIKTTVIGEFVLRGSDLNGVQIEGISVKGAGPTSTGTSTTTNGIGMTGCIGCTLRNIYVEGMHYGLKLSYGGRAGSNWTVDGITIRNSSMPVYMSHMTDSTLSNLDFQAVGFNTNQWHAIYMEGGLRRLTFNDIKLAANGVGGGYVLQMYKSGTTYTSGDITFNNISLTATGVRGPLVIWGYENVTFNNLTASVTDSSYPIVRTNMVNNYLFNGLSTNGGQALISKYSSTDGPVSNITFKNGSYYGPQFASDSTKSGITNLTFDNVGLNSEPPIPLSTTTTLPSTSTTSTSTTTTSTTTTTIPTTTTLASTTTLPTTTTTTTRATTTTSTIPVTTTTLPQNFLSVSFLAPPDGSRVSGKTSFRVYANTNLNVSRVDLYIDGVLRSSDRKYPYYFSVNTSGWTSGTHTIKAIAYTTNGLSATKQITVIK